MQWGGNQRALLGRGGLCLGGRGLLCCGDLVGGLLDWPTPVSL